MAPQMLYNSYIPNKATQMGISLEQQVAQLAAEGHQEIAVIKLPSQVNKKRRSSFAKGGSASAGSVRSTDTNTSGHALRSSSGSGMTFTKAAGLGKEMVNDLGKAQRRYKSQVRSDRRAFVLGN